MAARTIGSVMAESAAVFIPGLGFRSAGIRMERPVSVEQDGRTLTVRHLVATTEATDLVYDITLVADEVICGLGETKPWIGFVREQVVLRGAENEYRVTPTGHMRTSVVPSKATRTMRLEPLPLDLRRVELRLSSAIVGEWSLPIDLVPFGDGSDQERRAIDASDRHRGITISVRHLAVSAAETAVGIELSTERPVQMQGIGGLHGLRDGPTPLTLRDQTGRIWAERGREDRETLDPAGRVDVAVFDPLPADAQELELEIPFVYLSEHEARGDVDLPVTAPVEVMLGQHPIRVLSSGEAPDSPRRRKLRAGPGGRARSRQMARRRAGHHAVEGAGR